MSKPSSQFLSFIINLPKKSLFLASCFFILILTYPGHNQLQSTVIRPGSVFTPSKVTIDLADYPVNDGTLPPPVASTSYIIQDLTSKTIIASRRPDTPLPPASITKLMTALVSIETWPDPTSVLTVQNEARAIGQTIDLVKGEQLTLDSLLHGLLIHSGNDAALVLADNYPGGYTAFVSAMNKKAQELKLAHTTFKNPSGIDQYGHITTARDIATLSSVTLTHPVISTIVTKERATITNISGDLTHELESTDELLTTLPGLKGGKTGWTTGAGECFVSYVDRGGRGIITVVLGSSDRFADTTALVEWVYAHHTWIDPKQ